MKELHNNFKENYCGVLDHQGCIKVAGYDVPATIKYINIIDGECHDVLVKNSKKSYVAKIHKDLLENMIFCEIGDTAFIKFKQGKAWITGFRKAKDKWIKNNVDEEIVIEGDYTLLQYFQEQQRLSDFYDKGVKS